MQWSDWIYHLRLGWTTSFYVRFLILCVILDAVFTVLIVVEEGRRDPTQPPSRRYFEALASWTLALLLLITPAALRMIIDATL